MRKRDIAVYTAGMGIGAILSISTGVTLFEVNVRADVRRLVDQDAGLTIRAMPDPEVLAELSSKRAAYDNCRNITGFGDGMHESFFVHVGGDLPRRLRPGVRVEAHFLKPRDELNLDPPVLYIDPSQDYSDAVQEYIRRECFLHYDMSSEPEGYAYRTTLPRVEAERRILVVGDSVAFGLGVDDDLTMPSYLQRRVGADYQVVNAGMPGYETGDNMEVVTYHADKRIEHLVYVLCRNDLEDEWSVDEIIEVLRELASAADAFATVTVVVHAYLSDVLPHLLAVDRVDDFEAFSERLASAVERDLDGTRMTVIDWSELARRHEAEHRSPFANAALYVDHCHFSARGNRLVAEAVAQALGLGAARDESAPPSDG